MRLVRVKTPEGKGADVAQMAVEVGISEASVYQVQVHGGEGGPHVKDVVDVGTSTPKAKAFVDAVMAAPFYDPREYSIDTRQPRAVASKEDVRGVTRPIVIPEPDIYEELWQFGHVTLSFVGRVLIGALILSYGMLRSNLLLMIAGLLFLPLLPLLLAVGFGALSREWRLAGQGLFAFALGTALIVAGGAAAAAMAGPPLMFREFSSTGTAFLISAAVGVAAGLATADDAGRRELIGLAATAQIALLPAYFGISLVIGFPVLESEPPTQRALTFLVAAGTITLASLVTYAALGMRGRGLRRFTRGSMK
jgi:hypothetical protein